MVIPKNQFQKQGEEQAAGDAEARPPSALAAAQALTIPKHQTYKSEGEDGQQVQSSSANFTNFKIPMGIVRPRQPDDFILTGLRNMPIKRPAKLRPRSLVFDHVGTEPEMVEQNSSQLQEECAFSPGLPKALVHQLETLPIQDRPNPKARTAQATLAQGGLQTLNQNQIIPRVEASQETSTQLRNVRYIMDHIVSEDINYQNLDGRGDVLQSAVTAPRHPTTPKRLSDAQPSASAALNQQDAHWEQEALKALAGSTLSQKYAWEKLHTDDQDLVDQLLNTIIHDDVWKKAMCGNAYLYSRTSSDFQLLKTFRAQEALKALFMKGDYKGIADFILKPDNDIENTEVQGVLQQLLAEAYAQKCASTVLLSRKVQLLESELRSTTSRLKQTVIERDLQYQKIKDAETAERIARLTADETSRQAANLLSQMRQKLEQTQMGARTLQHQYETAQAELQTRREVRYLQHVAGYPEQQETYSWDPLTYYPDETYWVSRRDDVTEFQPVRETWHKPPHSTPIQPCGTRQFHMAEQNPMSRGCPPFLTASLGTIPSGAEDGETTSTWAITHNTLYLRPQYQVTAPLVATEENAIPPGTYVGVGPVRPPALTLAPVTAVFGNMQVQNLQDIDTFITRFERIAPSYSPDTRTWPALMKLKMGGPALVAFNEFTRTYPDGLFNYAALKRFLRQRGAPSIDAPLTLETLRKSRWNPQQDLAEYLNTLANRMWQIQPRAPPVEVQRLVQENFLLNVPQHWAQEFRKKFGNPRDILPLTTPILCLFRDEMLHKETRKSGPNIPLRNAAIRDRKNSRTVHGKKKPRGSREERTSDSLTSPDTPQKLIPEQLATTPQDSEDTEREIEMTLENVISQVEAASLEEAYNT